MKKALVLTCVLVFAVAAVAMAGPFDKLKDAAGKAANMPKAEKHDFALGDLDASLKGWEAGAFDPGKMSYTTYGDATWDGIATNAVKLSMAVAFGEKGFYERGGHAEGDRRGGEVARADGRQRDHLGRRHHEIRRSR
ncbi:MAG: hypothetical protein M5R36_16410 [Deltaproteobacteria bacterium]|nr:hypothetical protein [Deltaproteobacteria bacterium]